MAHADGSIRVAMNEFRLPRSTDALLGDWRALERAERFAVTPDQRAACALRRADLTERTAAAWEPFRAGLTAIHEQIVQAWQSALESFQSSPTVRAYLDRCVTAEPADDDPMERALRARRERNTGPARNPHRRPPRRLNATR